MLRDLPMISMQLLSSGQKKGSSRSLDVTAVKLLVEVLNLFLQVLLLLVASFPLCVNMPTVLLTQKNIIEPLGPRFRQCQLNFHLHTHETLN